MKDFIAANSCVYLGLTLHDYGHRLGFNVCAQWTDEMQEHGQGIATGDGETIAEAMERMAMVMAAKRNHIAIDEALPVGELA